MISLIIPFYNCENTVMQTVEKVKEYAGIHKDIEFIAGNDGSTDNTYAVLKSAEDDIMRVAGYETNKGKGGAIQAGVAAAKGDKIIFTDADLAYGLEPIDDLAKALDDYDIAAGSRRSDSGISGRYGLLRSVASVIFSAVCEMMLHLHINDTQCGFKAFRGEPAKALFADLEIMRFGFDFEILAMARQNGYSIKSVPVTLIENSPNTNVNVIGDGITMLREIYAVRKKIKRRGRK